MGFDPISGDIKPELTLKDCPEGSLFPQEAIIAQLLGGGSAEGPVPVNEQAELELAGVDRREPAVGAVEASRKSASAVAQPRRFLTQDLKLDLLVFAALCGLFSGH